MEQASTRNIVRKKARLGELGAIHKGPTEFKGEGALKLWTLFGKKIFYRNFGQRGFKKCVFCGGAL